MINLDEFHQVMVDLSDYKNIDKNLEKFNSYIDEFNSFVDSIVNKNISALEVGYMPNEFINLFDIITDAILSDSFEVVDTITTKLYKSSIFFQPHSIFNLIDTALRKIPIRNNVNNIKILDLILERIYKPKLNYNIYSFPQLIVSAIKTRSIVVIDKIFKICNRLSIEHYHLYLSTAILTSSVSIFSKVIAEVYKMDIPIGYININSLLDKAIDLQLDHKQYFYIELQNFEIISKLFITVNFTITEAEAILFKIIRCYKTIINEKKETSKCLENLNQIFKKFKQNIINVVMTKDFYYELCDIIVSSPMYLIDKLNNNYNSNYIKETIKYYHNLFNKNYCKIINKEKSLMNVPPELFGEIGSFAGGYLKYKQKYLKLKKTLANK